jgi:uncharacterized membrane protein
MPWIPFKKVCEQTAVFVGLSKAGFLTIQSDTRLRRNGDRTASEDSMPRRGNFAVFGLPTVTALVFLYGFAMKYLTPQQDQYGIYWSRWVWVYVHVVAGAIALLVGPAQFWLGLNHRVAKLHRSMGILYVVAVVVGAASAYYLAAHNDFSWVFGLGLGSMATAWILTTALAMVSIVLRQVEQHREWMIRSYTVTFGFVIFRAIYEFLDMTEIGTMVERMTAASWLAWTLPLFLTECVLQGSRIFAKRAHNPQVQVQNEPSYDIPEEAVLDLQHRP